LLSPRVSDAYDVGAGICSSARMIRQAAWIGSRKHGGLR
jgi:hypothetical protein